MKLQKYSIVFPGETKTTSLRERQILSDGGTHFLLENKVGFKWRLRNVETNETKHVDESLILEGLSKKILSFVSPNNPGNPKVTDALDVARLEFDAASHQMRSQKKWIEALRERGATKIRNEPWIRSVYNDLLNGDLKETPAFKLSTLIDVQRRLERSGNDWTQLVPKFSQRGGLGKSRLDPRADEVISSVLTSIGQSKSRIVKTEICQSIRQKIESLNLGAGPDQIPLPGHSTIARRIEKEFDAYEICKRSNGRKFARKTYRNNSYPRDSATFPLLISEYDDIDTGVFLIDAKTMLPFGRGYLTHGVCQDTLVPLGFSLGHEPRSYRSAVGAIADSLLPKDLTRDDFQEATHPWVGYGCQGQILLDNASYNASQSTESRAHESNLILALARPYGSTEKTAVEHFNWETKRDFLPTLPGWRGDKSDPEAVKKGMQSAVLTTQNLRSLYVKWVTGVYLNKPGEDGLTPKQRWFRFFDTHSPAIRWSREQIALMRLRPRVYKMRPSGGVLRLKLSYNCPELEVLRDRMGPTKQVVVYSDFDDLSYLKVLDPFTKALIHIPCSMYPEYTCGLTEYQQQLVLKTCRRNGIKNPSIAEMVLQREQLADLVKQLARSNKLQERKFSIRAGEFQVSPNASEIQVKATQKASHSEKRICTELEIAIDALANITLDEEEGWE